VKSDETTERVTSRWRNGGFLYTSYKARCVPRAESGRQIPTCSQRSAADRLPAVS
jgi:hypothetical protein